MTSPNVKSSLSDITEQLVAIVGVDVPASTAVGLTRQRSHVPIDTRYLVGTVHVVPVVGEQWYVRRLGMSWALDRKLPFNTDTLATVAENPVEGLSQLGGENGPTMLQGSAIVMAAPLQYQTVATVDLPEASSLSQGSAIWDSTQNKMVVSDGLDWRDTIGTIVLGSRAVGMAGTGTLHATLMVRPFCSAQLIGNGRLTVRANSGAGRVVSFHGKGTVTVALKIGNRAALPGRGVFSAAARMYRIASPVALSGHGVLSASWTVFTPFNEENTARTNQAVPAHTAGAWVTLIGAGGAGGTQSGTNGTCGAGGGGGRVDRVFVPAASLGPTYSVNVGVGATTNRGSGTASTFSSASVSLAAGGGGGGGAGGSSSGGTAGPGGTCSVSGISATSHSGTAGGAGCFNSTTVNPGVNDTTNNVGCGGGSSGGASGFHAGAKGGNSNHVTGGAGGVNSGDRSGGSPASAGAGNGGAGGGGGGNNPGGPGGNGGLYGGGGGSGGYSAQLFGNGANGYTLLEWI